MADNVYEEKEKTALYQQNIETIRIDDSLYKEVFKNTPCLLIIINKNIEVVDINKAVVYFSGRKEAELKENLPGVVLNCIRASTEPGCGNHDCCKSCPVRNIIAETFTTGKPISLREAVLNCLTDGKRVEYTTLISSSLISYGGECNVLLSLTDISNQKRVEAELREREILHKKRIENDLKETEIRYQQMIETANEKEAQYRTLVESTSQVIFTINEEGTYLYINPIGAELLNTTPEQVIGKSMWDFFPKQIAEEQYQYIKQALKSGKFLIGRNQTIVQGQARWYEARIKPLQTREGTSNMALVILTDITESRKAENALRASEEKFSTAFVTSPDSININRLHDGLYININDGFCKMTGYVYEEVIGKTSKEIDIWVNQEDRRRLVEGLIKDGVYNNLEAEFRIKDRSIKTCLMSAKIIIVENEKCILSITRDISERKKAEEIIKKSLAEKETLLRELYHRTKNNMQVISAMLTLQAISTGNNELVDVLNETSNRIKAMSLVHQKLYQSQDLSHIYFNEYIIDLIKLLGDLYQIDRKKISVNLDLEQQYILIDYAVPSGLIINEIISNSFKYAFTGRDEGKINIKMLRDSLGRIEISIVDNGIGFPAGLDCRETNTLGMQLIHSLVEHQLDGELEINGEDGVHIKFAFYDNQYEARI